MYRLLFLTSLVLLTGPLGAASPPKTMPRAKVIGWLETEEALSGNKGIFTEANFLTFFGEFPEDVPLKDLEAFKKNPPSPASPSPPEPVKPNIEGLSIPTRVDLGNGLTMGFMIRRSFQDVLATEDPTLSVKDGGKAVKTPALLQGANFSYRANLDDSDKDRFEARGALILPFTWIDPSGAGDSRAWTPERWDFLPSVSIDRVDNGAKPTENVDSLIYRAGFAATFTEIPFLTELNARGYYSFATDSSHDSRISAFEFELEPFAFVRPRVAFGYKQPLLLKPTKDGGTEALVAYQWRNFIHFEAGSVNNPGDIPGLLEDDFVRLGPVTILTLDPFFHKSFSLNIGYRYFFGVTDFLEDRGRFEAGLQYTLFKDETTGRRATLSLEYIDGGLDLTQQEVETFTVGLGILF